MSYARRMKRISGRAVKVPDGYFPVSYDQLALVTGQSQAEMERSAEWLKSNKYASIIKVNGCLYCKLNIPS